MPSEPAFASLVSTAAKALKDRADEVNRLNVFPVPDGDTGTNMSLTMDAVIAELAELPADADVAAVCHAITQGSLMGARGNSGVILSQILRGLCDVIATAQSFDSALVAEALERSATVAFQAVRKPVEGTMLTVLRDAAESAREGADAQLDLDTLLRQVVDAAFESVRRTPELLPVLKENGVVDAGGFGLAILAEGLLAAYDGHEVRDMEFISAPADLVLVVAPEDDWDDQEYLYCTEFLLLGTDLDVLAVQEYISSAGGSELVVGGGDTLKIHVHTNEPGSVLTKMSEFGEVADVHINNMRRQTHDRTVALQAEAASARPPKSYGFVTVAPGPGLKAILESLGADVVVNGGQTMNPSTAELLEAVQSVNAQNTIIMPNNKNIVMAAQQAADHADGSVLVVPTSAVPEAFSALLAFDPEATASDNVRAMTEAAEAVTTGEVTVAIKDSKGKVGDIKKGQVIGITDHEIEVVGEDVSDVSRKLAGIITGDADTLTVLAGEDLDDATLDSLVEALRADHPHVEVDAHRGDQPLYPVIIAAE